MAEPCLSWSALGLFRVHEGHIWGREFQILPGGSMAHAAEVMHGLIGVEAEPIDGSSVRIDPARRLRIYGTRGTHPESLRDLQDVLADGFNAQAVQVQG